MDIARRKSSLVVLLAQPVGLIGNLLESVLDESVHDGHALGDTSIGVHLSEDIVAVYRVGLMRFLWRVVAAGFLVDFLIGMIGLDTPMSLHNRINQSSPPPPLP